MHTYIPWIHKFLTTGCGTSLKDIKHTDKYSDNKATKKQSNKTRRHTHCESFLKVRNSSTE